jgi:hypothetical protein
MHVLHSLLRLGSLTLLAGLLSLSGRAATPKDKPADDHHDHKHESGGHVHKPLMGGELVEVGEHQFNLEFKYDQARGVLQVWVLDAHAENFVRIPALSFAVQEEDGEKRVITVRAIGNDLTGEKPGDSSAFEGEAKWLGSVKHFDGLIRSLKIRGVEFRDIDVHFHPQE